VRLGSSNTSWSAFFKGLVVTGIRSAVLIAGVIAWLVGFDAP